MAVVDLFSKRQERLRGEVSDVYVHDQIPMPLRVQIVQIWREAFSGHPSTFDGYRQVVVALRREYGVFSLAPNMVARPGAMVAELETFVLSEENGDRVLSAIELSLLFMESIAQRFRLFADTMARAASEVNTRFREHGIGYQFENGLVIRVDSQLLHAEVVKPALSLLSSGDYDGAQEEFLKAHEHYRRGRTKEAMTECLKALESVMKTICVKRQWTFDPNASVKALIGVLYDNKLIPDNWGDHFSGLRATLEAGVPTIRNRMSGHGQGAQVVEVPQHIAAYVLHLTASAIVFLVEAEKAL